MLWPCYPQRLDLVDAYSATGLWYSPGPVDEHGGIGRLVAFVVDGGSHTVIVRATGIAPGMLAGGALLSRADGLYAGRAYWVGASDCLFHSAARAVWILRDGAGPVEPWLDVLDDGTLAGDSWHELSDTQFDPDPFGTSAFSFAPAGVGASSGSAVSVSPSFPRWEKNGSVSASGAPIAGYYAGVGGETTPLCLGIPQWHESATAPHPNRKWVLRDGVYEATDGSATLSYESELGHWYFSDSERRYGVLAAPAINQDCTIVDWTTETAAGILRWDGISAATSVDRSPAVRTAEVAGWLW